MKTLPPLVCASTLLAVAVAQTPQLRMDPAIATIGGPANATFDVAASPNSPFAVFLDLSGGPVDLFGQRFYLGLSANLAPMHTGLMPAAGAYAGSFAVPFLPGIAGVVLYGQAVVLDGTASNALFHVSGGASTTLHAGPNAIVEAFDNPVANGFTGTFASDIAGHVRGGPITTRVHRTIDPAGIFFSFPIATPLVAFGLRQQLVYRPQDVGAVGVPELLTAVRWHVHPAWPVTPDVHSQFELRIGHSTIAPNYAVDPWSALPVAPLSGLGLSFAANSAGKPLPQVAFSGAYVIDPAALLPGDYMPYPIANPFPYDGVSSLLLEFRVSPSTASASNGGVVHLMVQSDAHPFGRVIAAGTATNFLVPGATANATTGDNAMHDLELVFARVETNCVSPWLDSARLAPDYQAPIVAQSLPPGTSVVAEFRGSASANGAGATGWSTSQDVADGMRYLQFRLVLRANSLTGERPVVDTLVVPHQ